MTMVRVEVRHNFQMSIRTQN